MASPAGNGLILAMNLAIVCSIPYSPLRFPAPLSLPSLFPPRGIHLANGADASTSMAISYQTPNTTSDDYVATAQIGTAPAKYERVVHGFSMQPYQCGVLSGYQHHVNITGLQGGTKYFYRVGSDVYGWSPQYHFTTGPSGPQNTSFIFYGDMGVEYSDASIKLIEDMVSKDEVDFLVHNGDISYADNLYYDRNGTGYLDWMDTFYDNIRGFATTMPIMFAPGNHEWPCDMAEYKRRQAMMPSHDAGSWNSSNWYAHTFGQIRMISLSGENGELQDNTTPQFKWLKQQLRIALVDKEAGRISWIFTHSHYMRQPTGYCTYDYGQPSSTDPTEICCVENCNQTSFQKEVEDLFVQYHVDVHFTSHEHVYERTYPVYRYKKVWGLMS